MKYSSSNSIMDDSVWARVKPRSLSRILLSSPALVALSSWASPCAASDDNAALPPTAESSVSASDSPADQDPKPTPSTSPLNDSPAVNPEVDTSIPVSLPPPPAGSGGIAVFPVAATNLSQGESDALGVLFASELRDEKGGRVIAPDIAGQFSFESSDLKGAASYLKVSQYIFVEAVRLDRTTIVTATLYNQDGSVAWSAKMYAKSVDDFQHVSERMVVALLTKTSIEKTRTLDNITVDESEGNNRLFVEKVFGFKTSLTVPYSSKARLASMVGLSFDGRLEGDRYFLEFGGGFLIPGTSSTYGEGSTDGYGGLFADIGGSYYLTQSVVSPYVGVGVMPRILSTQPANLAAYSQAGLMFFRTSSSRLYTELRVAQNLTPMELSDYSYDFETGDENNSITRFWPIEFGLNVGLGW